MNTGSARTAPPSSGATYKPQPTQSSPQAARANNDENIQRWKGSEFRGHSQQLNGNNYYGDNLIPARQSFSSTKSFDNSITLNGNNIGLKVPNNYDTPPPKQPFQ
jgi:hypothetical protein